MGIFDPQNNLGLEIFFIGIVGIVIFEFSFFIWIRYSNRKWEKKKDIIKDMKMGKEAVNCPTT
jgi:preprotein translocase subunit YajC